MAYDILLIIVILFWSLQKIIDKKLIKNIPSNEFTKWTIILNFVLILPIIFLVKIPTMLIIAVILVLSLLTIVGQLFLYKGIKIDEISRVTPFQQFSVLFALLLSYLFLNEQLSALQYVGILGMFLGGFLISMEKPFKKKLLFHNRALLLVFISALLSSFSIFANKFLLNLYVTAFTLIFFRRLLASMLVLPTIKKIKISNWYLFLLSRFFSTYGLLLFLWVLSKQQLSLTVPFLAVQPLLVAILSKQILKERLPFLRMLGIISIILGYVLLKV